MGKVRNEDIGMNVIRRVNKFYQVLSADMDEMKVIFWVPFDHDDDAKIAELNRYIKDIENSKNHPNTKKGPYEFEFGFGSPDLGGEIHSLEGMEDDDSFVLSAWFDDTNALYDLEEENSYTEDIFRVITYYLHRLKCDKDSYYGESISYKGNKMNLSEAKQELREHGYSLLKETRRVGMPRQVFHTEDEVDKEEVLDVLHGYILTNKKAREIVANYFKKLLDVDDVQVYNSYYTQKVINHMTYADEGERQEKGTFLEVNGQTYLLIPNYLYHGVETNQSFQELVKTGKLEPKKPY